MPIEKTTSSMGGDDGVEKFRAFSDLYTFKIHVPHIKENSFRLLTHNSVKLLRKQNVHIIIYKLVHTQMLYSMKSLIHVHVFS